MSRGGATDSAFEFAMLSFELFAVGFLSLLVLYARTRQTFSGRPIARRDLGDHRIELAVFGTELFDLIARRRISGTAPSLDCLFLPDIGQSWARAYALAKCLLTQHPHVSEFC
ncbi:MAG: hypothetical protein WCE62_01995 [Polyangiales bacterium]